MPSSLPTELPKWYELQEGEEKGWTPKANQVDIPEVRDAWNGKIYPEAGKNFTVKLDRLQILSPIQVGGGSFPEGGILPAQIGGVPYIPGSSVRGSLLKYIRTIWSKIPNEEQQFWLTLLEPDLNGWQPLKIRFESILLKDLKAFPLYAQQEWQIFDQKSNKLSLQWQVSPKPPHPNPDRFRLQVLLKNPPKPAEKTWLETRLKEMLERRGIGRGTASGFGRLATSIPTGKWELHLTGMKPCVRSHNQQQTGQYRWSPQVLRATLRGYFIRFALDFLPRKQAELLTEKLFGGLGTLAKLRLTSYLYRVQGNSGG
ncbi:MAG: RAMP superfamily CRISPR-associated protein, partial [Planktothrix sp.]|uniref:RAMP superfamily CRISPR-associated protein n=1 Tax=Planktothrix sp. TaxID=3088171 RepID=UPI0038D36D34